VQRQVLEKPSLRQRSLVLFSDDRGTKRVRFASGAALKSGIKQGQTLAAAMAIDPAATRLPFELEAERSALMSLGESLLPLSPGFQVDPPDGLWLDASAAHLSGDESDWMGKVVASCRSRGYVVRGAVGSERFTTRILSRWRETSVAVVPPRGGGALASLPIVVLDDSELGDGASAPFRALGLSTLGELMAVSTGALVARFGSMGSQAARLCRGDDASCFSADVLPDLIEESVQLDWPAEQLEPVLFALKTVVDRVCARLQGRQLAVVRLVVVVQLESTKRLVPLVLARPSSQSKLLIELIRHHMTDLTVEEPISALHVRIEETSAERGRQLNLGDAPVGEAALEVVLSRLNSTLGEAALFCAEPAAAHRPESSWVPVRFAPPRAVSSLEAAGRLERAPKFAEFEAAGRLERAPQFAELEVAGRLEYAPQFLQLAARPVRSTQKEEASKRWPKRRAKTTSSPKVNASLFHVRPPRLLRVPSPLDVELSPEGVWRVMTFAGRRRVVEAVWGPERLMGDWWGAESFARDYYRVQLEDVGLLWVFRDEHGGFFLHGMFD
jgi:protein ImuB